MLQKLPAVLGPLMCVIAGIYSWKHHPLFFRLIFYEALLSFVVEAIGAIPMKNIWVYNLYILVDIFILWLAMLELMPKENRRNYRGLILLFAACWIVQIATTGMMHLVNWSYILGGIIVIFLIFVDIVKHIKHDLLRDQELAYLLVMFGLLLFFSSTQVLFSLYQLLISNQFKAPPVFYITASIECLRYLLTSIAFIILTAPARKKINVTI